MAQIDLLEEFRKRFTTHEDGLDWGNDSTRPVSFFFLIWAILYHDRDWPNDKIELKLWAIRNIGL